MMNEVIAILLPTLIGISPMFILVAVLGFDIDHVAIAPGSVFAIETKHRLKPAGKGAERAAVGYDGKALRFPDWTETRPVEQAQAQARWLAERLTRSTGDPVRVRAVLALPGWYLTTTAPIPRDGVLAMNPKNCGFMLRPLSGDAPLTPEAIRRIAFQVEQWCRMPEPGSTPPKLSKPAG
jgi:hypothetical protein